MESSTITHIPRGQVQIWSQMIWTNRYVLCWPFFQNVSIGIVGKDMEFIIYDDNDVAPFLEGLEERPQRKVGHPYVVLHVKVLGQWRFCDGSVWVRTGT